MNELIVKKYSNAIILPYKRDPRGTTGLGGVLDSNGNFIEDSYCHGGRFEHGGFYEWNKSILKKSNEKVFYFGYFLPHWGHFLIDCLDRMWPFGDNKNDLSDYKIAFISNQSAFYPNCYDFFAALGIDKSRIIWIDVPTQFAEIQIPAMSYTPEPGRFFYPQYIDMFNRVIDSILAKTPKSSVEKRYGTIDKVYFTRSQFNNALSREVGLKVIDSVMRNGGFNILAPEKLSLADQVAIWNYASEIACINGTIPLNVIFNRNRCTCGGGKSLKLIVLNKMNHAHTNLIEYLDIRKGVNCRFIDVQDKRIIDLSIGDGRGLGPFRIGITKELIQWMEENNIPTKDATYKENLVSKTVKYFLLFFLNAPRPWLAKHLPESFRKYARKFLRK